MDIKEENHLSKILKEYLVLAAAKYKKGVKKHGGRLWLKPDLIDQAIQENIDQMFYLFTLKDQTKGKNLGNKKYIDKDLCPKKKKNNIFVETVVKKLKPQKRESSLMERFWDMTQKTTKKI